MTDLDQKLRGVRMYLAERAKMRQIDFDQIHGLHVGDAREAVLTATDLTAILDKYDRRGAALVEAAKAIEALQADNERLQAEVTRLLTAFDGLDLAAPPASVGREEIARMLRDMIYLQSIDTDHRVVGYEHAADAILAALAPTPPEGEG